VKRNRLAQVIFYNDPDGYPPIVNAVRLLARAGWRIELLCRDSGQRWNVSYPPEAKVVRIESGGRGSWQEYAAFVARVLRNGSGHATLIYAHDMHALLPARMLATLYRKPLVYHSHDFADNTQRMSVGIRAVHHFQKRFARTADQVVLPDADRAQVVTHALRLKREPLIAANAPLTRSLAANTRLACAIAARGFRLNKVVFRQGRIGVGHAIEATLRSLPHWHSREWGFVVMGIGDPSYVEKLNGEARSLGVERQFVVLPPVGYDQVAEFTPGADIGHALYEPIHINNVHITTASNKIMEYMEAGLPLLVSDTPALRAFADKYGCGLAADEKSPESIAGAVNTMLGELEGARRMGAAARRAFEDVFCYERQFADVLDAFESLA
jgi:glycosyltransferase involved in cell wall biosynthesis